MKKLFNSISWLLSKIPGISPSLLVDLSERRFFSYVGGYLGFAVGIPGGMDLLGVDSIYVQKTVLFFIILFFPFAIFVYNHGRPGPDEWKSYEKIIIPIFVLLSIVIPYKFDPSQLSFITSDITISNKLKNGRVEIKRFNNLTSG